MKTLRLISCFILTSLLAASAQPGAPGAMPVEDLTLMKLFGSHKTFSAKSEIEASGMTIACDIAMLDGKIRLGLDMVPIKSKTPIPPEAVARVKYMGLDRVVYIVLPAQKKILFVFPNKKVYTSNALPEQAVGSLTNSADIQKTELSKETIDGHPCVKNKVVVAAADGKQKELTVWNATDLKDFPIQVQSIDKGVTGRWKYHDIQFAKPDAKLFEPPAGYKYCSDLQELDRAPSVMQQ